MEKQEKKPSKIEQAAEDLFNYAIDREDVKWLMGNLAKEADIKWTSVEYELPILKIISVGWSLSYYLAGGPQKDEPAHDHDRGRQGPDNGIIQHVAKEDMQRDDRGHQHQGTACKP